ncbi:MAG: ankyrin repeat domain-containing protein [Acidobacteria bacterium]|nr:ankyrin repeat domain-containing protein [Acidobacteriota bacterium]
MASAAEPALIDAVKAEDRLRIERLLAGGADVNAPHGDGATALHWAAHRDLADVAALLIRSGADVDAADDHGVTPLALACLNASGPMVGLLLAAEADPNLATTSGVTPLMTAARVGEAGVVRRLLEAGADPTAAEAVRGQTALMWAVAENHTQAAAVLLEVGGGATTRSANGFTPLLFAAQQGNVEVARLLLAAGADVEEAAPEGIGGDTNARVLFREGSEASVLLVAIDSGHADVARFLLERGADPNHDGAGRTPLHSAVQQELPDVVAALIAAGADPNARLEKPLPLVSRRIRQDNGLTPTTVGSTPFLLAASFGDVASMRILVDAGADPFLTSDDGTTALMVAAGADYVEGADKYGLRSYPAYYETLQQRALAATRLCLELGLDVNAVNDFGQTPLHGAVYMGGTVIAPYLVEQGAEMDVINGRGQTPWMIAAKGEYRAGSFYRHEETAVVLEALGADTTLGFDLGRDWRQVAALEEPASRR